MVDLVMYPFPMMRMGKQQSLREVVGERGREALLHDSLLQLRGVKRIACHSDSCSEM